MEPDCFHIRATKSFKSDESGRADIFLLWVCQAQNKGGCGNSGVGTISEGSDRAQRREERKGRRKGGNYDSALRLPLRSSRLCAQPLRSSRLCAQPYRLLPTSVAWRTIFEQTRKSRQKWGSELTVTVKERGANGWRPFV
jgi:hypothetical protein